MEDHPIPQNVSTFEFKLIGPMTVKQFGFLLAGIVPSVLLYVSPLPGFFKWPLIFLIGGAGAALAFLPIGGRSLDKWLIAFIKAIFSPTRRIWLKENAPPYFLQVSFAPAQKEAPRQNNTENRRRLEAYLRTIETQKSRLDLVEEQFIERLDFNVAAPRLPVAPRVEIPPTPTPQVTPAILRQFSLPAIQKKYPTSWKQPESAVRPLARLASEFNFTTEPVISVPEADHQVRFFHGIGHTRVRRLHQFNLPIVGEKTFELSQELKKRFGIPEKQASQPRQEASLASPVLVKRETSAPVAPRKRSPASGAQAAPLTIPLPQSSRPNTLAGIAVDQNGSAVVGAVILVKDSAGVPVRAFKTSPAGHFMSATPLAGGVYRIEIEKEDYTFAPVSVELKGEIISPIVLNGQQTEGRGGQNSSG